MKRIFSGVQPTGSTHLGNYLGALRNWVALQHEYESIFCIVNLHAITLPQDPKLLAAKARELARIYLAVGIDPQVSTIFIQSDVPAHAELTWLLNCIARLSELQRMTQFKDKVRKQRENVGVGLLDYPVLMAADILLYQTNLVPVGEDQKQHLELARDLAERMNKAYVGEDQKQHLELTRDLAIRFNRDYGETFRVPEAFIPRVGARIMSLSDPTRKMSKSDDDPNGCVLLLDDADTISRKFKRAVTDSGAEIRFDETRPALANLLTIYHLLTGKEMPEVEAHFAGSGYARLKQELAEVTIEFLKPVQQRVQSITDEELNQLLEQGRDRARSTAEPTLHSAMERMGLAGARN
jgi:tryptophanyl-tRNA synthetase